MNQENSNQISNPSEVNNIKINYLSILLKIFYTSQDEPLILSPIIKSTDDILYLFYLLKNRTKLYFKEKLEIVKKLMLLFKSNTNLIHLFIKRCKSNITNFYEPIIDLYMDDSEENSEENKKFFEEMLVYMVNISSIPKFLLEYIYQKLSVYLRYNSQKETIEKLSRNQFLKYLNLLEIFYTNTLDNDIMNLYNINKKEEEIQNNENILNNNSEHEKLKEIKNYLFFNGINSKITIFIDENSNNINCDFPTMEQGFSFVFWINLEKHLINEYYKVNNGKNINNPMTLINIVFGDNQIRVQLIKENKLLILFGDMESKPIDIPKNFKFGNWNNICIIIGNKKSDLINIFINGELLKNNIDIPKKLEINFSEKISNISLFENLIGKINSVLICPNTLNSDLISYFKDCQGFYKIKYLYKFLLSINKNYYEFSQNYKYIEKFRNQTTNKNYSKLNIKSNEQNIKNIIGLFCCFTYNEHKKQIDDVFGNYKAIISSEDDGAINYIKYYKNIEQIGEINNLLPIIELMFLSHNKEKLCSSININNNEIDIDDLLTEEIFLKFMHLVKKIIKEKKLNLICANKTKFFSHLGLFLEKFPSKMFNNRIRNIFYELGKESFQFSDEKSNFSHTFINMILLNEKIFSKFSEENQLNLWDDIHKFFTSDYSQLKDSLNMSKICLLLRFYDKDRYSKYCCKRHAELFDDASPDNILNPDMDKKVGKLFEIIQLFVDNLSTEPETANLFKLLSLDLSPCLQKKIITVYKNFFHNRKISHENKGKAFDILLSNNLFDIFQYCLSISLFDIRIELIDLLRILQEEFREKMKQNFYENKTLIKFICEFLLPDNLKVILDNDNNNNDNNNKIIPLNKYFNQDIYNNDIKAIYEILNRMMIYKVLISKMEGNVEKVDNGYKVNPVVINIFIIFVSKVSPYYIDSLLILLFSLVANTTIFNRETFLNNDYFYKWLFEIIFFFNNKENEALVEEKEKTYIELIKSHSIELYKQFIAFKNPDKGKILMDLMNYSFYLREKSKNDQNQIREITKITRTLLSITIEILSSEHPSVVDVLAKVCVEFMFLYKKTDHILEDKNKINISKDNNETKIKNDFGEGIYENKEDSNNIINIEKNNDNKIEFDNNIEDKNNSENNININNINTMDSIFNLILIPDTLMNNIYLKEEKEIKDKTSNLDNNILNSMWEDFNLYNFILDYYHDNLWGIEAMCKHIKINYDKNLDEIFPDLLKKYTDNKHKNILLKMLNKYLYNSENEKKDLINYLLILLCVAYDTTLDKEEKTLIEKQIEQFLIFCVLCSVNITQSEKSFTIIQNKLYDLIGFGLLFFKKRNEEKYNNFFEKIILPLFGTISENHKKGIKGIFTLSKKFLYKNTAIDLLFSPQEIDSEENLRDNLNKNLIKTYDPGIKSNNLNINDDIDEGEANKKNKKKKDKKEKKEKRDKKKENKVKIIFRGNPESIVKHIIYDTFNSLIDEIYHNINITFEYIKEYYKKSFLNRAVYEENQLIKREIDRINLKILTIVPDLENNIRKYSSTSLIQENKRRKHYQKAKKKLFSWRYFWSQKYLFYSHPEYLKLKLKNHFTKEMSKIILSPILDIDYDLPSFSKFKPEKLFNNGDFKYKINLNIENILLGAEEAEDENIKKKEKNNDELILSKNKYGFNYLECLYKLNYVGLWDKYKIHYEQKINLDINDDNNLDIADLNLDIANEINQNLSLNQQEKDENKNHKFFKRNKKTKKVTKNISIFKCCLVKSTLHLKGYITFNNKKIIFNYVLEEKDKTLSAEEILEDPSYDKDMNNCFGSTFKPSIKDKDKVTLSIYYKNIKYIFIKRYFYQNTAMEIYTLDNKSYFFNFKTNSDLTNYLNQILNLIHYRMIKTEDHKGKKLLGYEQMFNNNEKKIKSYYISNKIEEWQNYKISTLEYLMWLNIYSGRSFNDLTQYPVFPWVIINYTTNELSKETDFRNLSLPIGMMELIDNEKSTMRKENFIEIYNSVKNDLKENFHDFNYQDFLKKGEEYFYSYRNKKLKANSRFFSVQITASEKSELNMGNIKSDQNLDNQNEAVELVELNQLPSFYGSHYSNPTYVSHFLTRVFPFSFISIEIQGEKFDDPNRIFHSMEKTFESCMTLKDDIRELIPEFYYFPEMFKNLNNLNLTQDLLDANGEKIIINDVELPPWSGKNRADFIVKMRNILENNKTKINKWIDIIFGILQKGEKAEEIHNIFQAQTYEGMVRIEKIKDIDMRDATMRLVEVGVTPMQIFDKESKGKLDEKKIFKNNIFSFAKGLFLDNIECKLNKFFITSANYKSIYNKSYENYRLTINRDYKEIIYPEIISIKCINPKNLKIFTNKSSWYNIKISNHDNKPVFEETAINFYYNNSSKFAPSFQMNISKIPYVIYEHEKYIIKGGFWDSHLEINSLFNENEKKEKKDKKEKEKEKDDLISSTIFVPMYGPIITMKMTLDEKLLFCGSEYGNIIIFEVLGPHLNIYKVLYDHSDAITSIAIDENLNMFASSSRDGYINIYILPSFKMIRSILISKTTDYESNFENLEKEKNEENLFANNVFLSNTPLPCYTIYISEKLLFKTFSINGELIYNEKEEESTGIKCPIIFKNLQFNDFLIYGTENGFIKIRSFPDMKLINSIKPSEDQEIKALELSPDKRFCYAWSNRDKIIVIKDINTSTGFEVKEENKNPDDLEVLMDKIISE